MDDDYPAPLTFGSKAETLARLRQQLTSAIVLPLCVVNVAEWRHNHSAHLDRIAALFPSGPLIVRSSAHGEDRAGESLAGAFLSVKQVVGRDALETAINAVIASFGREHDADQVLIQPMLIDVSLSGVAFTP